jgi:hypothetical protein
MVLNAETFDRPRHAGTFIACCVHLGTQHAVIRGEVFALHLLVNVGTAVAFQLPRSYIPSVEVIFVPIVLHDRARTSTCDVSRRKTLPQHMRYLTRFEIVVQESPCELENLQKF